MKKKQYPGLEAELILLAKTNILTGSVGADFGVDDVPANDDEDDWYSPPTGYTKVN